MTPNENHPTRTLARSPSAGLRVGLMLLVAVVSLPVLQADGDWWLLGVVGAAGVLSEFWRRVGAGRSAHMFVQTAALSSVVFLWIETQVLTEPAPPVLGLSHFLVLLCACKFFELRAYRDYGVVLTIALLLLVVGGLVSAHILFGAALAFGLTYGVFWMVQFQQSRVQDGIAARRAARADVFAAVTNGDAPSEQRSLPLRTRLRASSLLGLMLGAVAVATFVITPRGLGPQFFGRWRTPFAGAVTGFSDRVELSTGGIAQSDLPVLRVRLTRGGEPYGHDGYPLYLRGRTLSRYAQRRWRPTPSVHIWHIEPTPLEEPRALSSAYTKTSESQLIRQDIWLERNSGPYLFSLYPPVAVSGGETFELEQDCDDLSIKIGRYNGSPLHYTVVSAAEGAAESIGPLLAREYVDRVQTQMTARRVRNRENFRMFDYRPGDAPDRSQIPTRVEELARELIRDVGDSNDPRLHARITERFMARLGDGTYQHTLDPVDVPRGQDRVETFLFETRRGHCEFFASALAMMCQSVGLTARVVTGYAGGEFNPVGAFFVLRRKDAHAWVEVKLPDRGWVVYDPTPGAGGERAPPSTDWLAALQRLGEYAQFEWVTFVVSFDTEYRRQIFGRFEGWFRQIDESRGGLSRLGEIALAFLRGPPELNTQQRVWYWIMLVLTFLMALLVARVVWILWIMIREWLPRRRPAGLNWSRRTEARFYDRLLRLLERRGYAKPARQTPREFGAHVASADPRLARVAELTEWYYQAQFGGRELTASQRAAIREYLGFLREGLPILSRFRGVAIEPPLRAVEPMNGNRNPRSN